MAKRQANFRLSDEALAELKNLSAREGKPMTEILEALILERPGSTSSVTEALGWLSAELATRAGAWDGKAPEWFPEPPEWLELWQKALDSTSGEEPRNRVDPDDRADPGEGPGSSPGTDIQGPADSVEERTRQLHAQGLPTSSARRVALEELRDRLG